MIGLRMTEEHIIGKSVPRKEGRDKVTGAARYIDDINVTGQLWAAFVRSPEAHAKIVSIDTSDAKSQPGVVEVYTGHDLDLEAPLPMAWVPPGIEVKNPPESISKEPIIFPALEYKFEGTDATQVVQIPFPVGHYLIDVHAKWNTNGHKGNFDTHGNVKPMVRRFHGVQLAAMVERRKVVCSPVSLSPMVNEP